MKLRHILIIQRKNNQIERSHSEFSSWPVILGRGASSDILLPYQGVALEHLRFTISDRNFFVEDISQRGDLFVNGALKSTSILGRGDKFKIAGIEFEVSFTEDAIEIIEQRDEKAEDKIEEGAQASAKRLSIGTYLPTPWRLSFIFATILLLFYLALPVSGVNTSSWSSGPISNNHKMIEQNCAACHGAPFRKVEDDKCLTCHVMTDHAANINQLVAAHSDLQMRCADCHQEHNGDHVMVEQEAARCVTCHGNLTELLPTTTHPNILNFESHPEFRVALASPINKNETIWKRLDERPQIQDPTQIELNHKLHLQPDLRSADGAVTLECSDCHRASEDRKSFLPITFERDCKSCHPLSFDARLPGQEVPHGNSAEVFDSLYAQYAQAALGGRRAFQIEEPITTRQKPGGEVEREADKVVSFDRANVIAEARKAEKEIFTKTACQLCHSVNPVDVQDVEFGPAFEVVEPHIPTRWMTAARFDHGAHDEVSCEGCHKSGDLSVRDSTMTSDILMPGISDCRACHSDAHEEGKVQSECVMCHSFHDSLGLNQSEKREISEIAVSFNREAK